MTKKRRGRPRKPGRRLASTGELADAPLRERTEDIVKTATEARRRVFGILGKDASNPLNGSAVGRLRVGGMLSPEQFEAAEEFEKICREWNRAILARPVPSAGDLDRGHGFDASEGTDPAYVARFLQARSAFVDSRRTLLEADPFAWMAVTEWVLHDKWLMRLVGELRIGLNALAKHYGVGDWQSGGRLAASA